MAAVTADAEILKLTTDESGRVWYVAGEGMPHNSQQMPADFLPVGSPTFRWTNVRVAGTPDNADLLLRLFECKRRGEIENLAVCSPLCCEAADDRRDPAVLLHSMRDFGLAASLGGWHEFKNADALSYLLVRHFTAGGQTGEEQLRILVAHPVWPALSFVNGAGSDACCRLLALLIDPRWYVDVADPNRDAKLEQFLGLNPRTLEGVNRGEESWRHDRCRLVLSCWKTGPVPGPRQPLGPRQFLWRHWLARGGGPKGDLAACKLFVSFLRAAWTDAVCDGPKKGRLFVPELFFGRTDEAAAYREHTRKATT